MSALLRCLLTQAAALAIVTLVAVGGYAAEIHLPPVFSGNELLSEDWLGFQSAGSDCEITAFAFATNNFIPLRSLNDRVYESRTVAADSVNARLQYSGCFRMRSGQWIVSAGHGSLDEYEGNRDAAQFWVDLRSKTATSRAYEPHATQLHVLASWVGIGRDIPFQFKRVDGNCELSARWISAEDFTARVADGYVQEDQFSGMIKTVYASSSNAHAPGNGWALDCLITGDIRDRWQFAASVDGLAGRLTWRDIMVDDDYVSSPGVFEDPDGFLHDYFTVSGAGWRKDMSVRLSRTVRLDMASTSRSPHLLLGVIADDRCAITPSVGLAWSQPHRWAPLARFYPNQKRIELGIVGPSWKVCASGNGVYAGDSTEATLEVGGVLAF